MRTLFLFISLTLFVNLNAQVNLDSLWGVWNDPSQPDTNRLKAMLMISWDGYLFSQPDSAYYFAQLQYDFAKEKGKKKFMAIALNTQGSSLFLNSNYKKAIKIFLKSIKIKEEIGDKKGIAASLNNIGAIYINQSNYPKGIDYLTQSIKIRVEIGDKLGNASSLNNIGAIYKEQGDYAMAIEYYNKSLKINEEIGDKICIAASLSNIGAIYIDQGDYAKAIDYFTQDLEIEKEIGDKKGIASSLNNIGAIYQNQGNYAKALDYHIKSLKIKEEIGNKQGIASSFNNFGFIYQNQGDYTKAIEYYTKSLKINEEIGYKKGIVTSLNSIGIIYIDQGDYLNALKYFSHALSIAQEIGTVIQIREAASSLWNVNKKLGRYKPALEMYELYISSRDSLESEENQKEVIRQEYKYAYEKQAATDSIKTAEANKVKDAQLSAEKAKTKQQKQRSYFLFGGLALALIFGGFIFNRFRVTNKQKGIIEKQKQEVDNAYDILEEKNQEILDSISYAKRIQNAILPPTKLVKEYLNNSFIIYKPKDIVAGDFYWMEPTKKEVLFAVADCTGHGVPGAMVSVVCNNGLNRSVREHGLSDPGKILDKTREIIIQEFEKSEEEVKDGMDIALCSIKENKLKYAGAHNPLWIVRDGQIIETKANKQPIGKFDNPEPYKTHTIDLQKGDTIYLFSDGYADQFGGEKEKKFKTKPFKELLISIQEKSMEEQKSIIDETFEKWKGDLEQLDDVCVIGLRV